MDAKYTKFVMTPEQITSREWLVKMILDFDFTSGQRALKKNYKSMDIGFEGDKLFHVNVNNI